MKDQSRKLVSHVYRPSRPRLLRTVWGGAIATVAAGGLLFTASDGAPALRLPDSGRGLPAQAHGPSKNVTVRQTETVPERVSMDQVVAVLERAERQAREQGPDLSPTTAQAAAELGMLYTTYQMQLALGEQDDGARRPPPPADVGSAAVRVSYSVVEPGGVEPDMVEAENDQVTFGQLVVAAERLANLLDSALPDALVDVQRADQREGLSPRAGLAPSDLPDSRAGRGSSLRASLLDVVTTFSGSTLGYANGRIPAAVLCPLEFAPGHLLRCDAAERLTALSEAFEREFGYPIPITDSYRPYLQQVSLASTKPHLAAVPGTSNHGWGLAVDLSDPISGGTSQEYTWLRLHGPDYGWDNPSWARPGGTKPEPWHFEFFAAGSIPNRAIGPSDVGAWGAAGASGASGGASPRPEPARDLEPKDDSASGETAKPVARPAKEPAKEPGNDQPSQKPAKPGPKPHPKPTPTPTPTPSEPRPKPPTASPSPSPTPTPSPSPSPTPSPSPSEPSQGPSASPSPTPPEPSPTPSDGGKTPSPTPSAPSPEPSPSISEAPGPVSRATEELGLAVGDTED